MFKNEENTMKFVRGYCAFNDKLWSPETKWTEALFAETRAKDFEQEWQGQKSKGIKGSLEQWKPMKGAFVECKTSEIDIESFSSNGDENKVTFNHHCTLKTFENKEMFAITRCILDVDNEGKVLREKFVLEPKYGNAMMASMMAFTLTSGLNGKL